ncbi:hypothetical protein HQO84_16945 [Rhodococcus fascians]|jgi:hypothetical protein|nr:hypothetical protein [Rhodococcus fascians]MBY3998856.1 hypothetical protein [Rhodococcus fascians]MBY4003548.1 hypothetical protein [Rhodococcus fascians]MBY4008298.1 hypothetical protein [Rhodococcus fascians]MBY4018431.1 hypothetical protein [Rhodococcus fascians]
MGGQGEGELSRSVGERAGRVLAAGQEIVEQRRPGVLTVRGQSFSCRGVCTDDFLGDGIDSVQRGDAQFCDVGRVEVGEVNGGNVADEHTRRHPVGAQHVAEWAPVRGASHTDGAEPRPVAIVEFRGVRVPYLHEPS